MYDWASSKPIIVSNKEEITKTLNISEETATQIINYDFNNGYGASLINEHVIIIDSVLNALRMIQWLKILNALQELESVFDKEISKANFSSEIKTKINISSVLKHAKSSPLAAYSDLHKQFVEGNIKEAINRCNKKLDVKFQDKKKPTIVSLQKRLVEEKALHKAEISKLASQKMSEYLQLMDIKNGK